METASSEDMDILSFAWRDSASGHCEHGAFSEAFGDSSHGFVQMQSSCSICCFLWSGTEITMGHCYSHYGQRVTWAFSLLGGDQAD